MYEGKSIELEIPDKKTGDVTAIVTVAMDVTTTGNPVVHLSIPHVGKGHYDIYHYTLYAVDAKNRRHAFPLPDPEEEAHFDEPFERLSDFPEGERFSLSPQRHRHILDDDEDDVNIVVNEDERRYSVPLDVPTRAHEMFDEAFGELQDRVNDRRLSKKQRKANAKGMKRFRDVHERLVEQERKRDLKVEHNWVTETLRMMKESEDAGWYGQADRFLRGRGGPSGSVLARAAREDEMREQLRKHHHLHRALEQSAREEQEAIERARIRQQQHEDALEFIRRSRIKEQGSPGGAWTDIDAHIGTLVDGGEGEGVNAAHMLRIGTLLLDCITLAGDTGDADMIAKLGTLAQVCGHCDHVGACHHRCKHCKHTAYCNTDCARADWTRHRAECVVVKK